MPGVFSNAGTTDRRRRESVFRHEGFENYLRGQIDLLSESQRLALPRRLTGGMPVQRFIMARHLDSKLPLLGYLNKSCITVIFDPEGMTYNDFKKAMSVYLDELQTQEATQAIEKHRFFVINPRGVASWLCASSLYFDTELYRASKKRKKSKENALSTAEEIEANKRVLKMLFRTICAADGLNQKLETAGLDFDGWVALGKVYFSNRPLYASELVLRTQRGKTLGKNPRGNYSKKIKDLVDRKFLTQHKLDKQPAVYTITTKGTELFLSALTDCYDKATDV